MSITFEHWWRHRKSDLRRELDEHGLIVQEVAQDAWNAAIDSAAVVAFDLPLESGEECHSYRWSTTGKSMAWDISHAIRKRLTAIFKVEA